MCIEAYAAGLLDGEGCLFVRNNSGRSGGKQLAVQFFMTDSEPLYLLSSRWGYDVAVSSKTATGRLVYRWMVTGPSALEFLKDVMPWLQGKREQAELCLTYPLWGTGHRV